MNNYSDSINSNIEEARNGFRRFGIKDNSDFSNQSVLNIMGDLIKAINTMDETVLVPCRLMDLKVGDAQDHTAPKMHKSKSRTGVQEYLNSADLFDVYNMLNGIKVDLLWGQNFDNETSASATQNCASGSNIKDSSTKNHTRRPSTVSVTSINSSTSISDCESDTGNENDSGIEEVSQAQDKAALLAQHFRRHLHGLTACLRQLNETTQYITSRYQHDIGHPV